MKDEIQLMYEFALGDNEIIALILLDIFFTSEELGFVGESASHGRSQARSLLSYVRGSAPVTRAAHVHPGQESDGSALQTNTFAQETTSATLAHQLPLLNIHEDSTKNHQEFEKEKN